MREYPSARILVRQDIGEELTCSKQIVSWDPLAPLRQFRPLLDEPMFPTAYIQTGQLTCNDVSGHEIPCEDSGQDAVFARGIPWPDPRFTLDKDTVLDRLTGLAWTRDANVAEFPLTWQEALEWIRNMNVEHASGFSDWRLPNRRELRSLVSHQTRRPALPAGHPFVNVFPGWYWTSTTAAIAPNHAWYVSMDGARMFYGGKDQSFLVWPVRGMGTTLPVTGQKQCYAADGTEIPCTGTGQDAAFQTGVPWPDSRFLLDGESIVDQLTRLRWLRKADLTGCAISWPDALAAVKALRCAASDGIEWRLPNINELESLVDCARHSPALSLGHPFTNLSEAYWSSTTSMFEPDWAWALYLDKGAIGVGQKSGRHFRVWPVADTVMPQQD